MKLKLKLKLLFFMLFFRLWHQLTLTCESLYSPSISSAIPKQILISIFKEFIEKWSKKMNQLSFTKLAVKVAELLGKNLAILSCYTKLLFYNFISFLYFIPSPIISS